MADTALASPAGQADRAGAEELPTDVPKTALGFEAAYDAYGPMVYRLAMVYLGSRADAEDVTQEAFVRLLRRAPAFGACSTSPPSPS